MTNDGQGNLDSSELAIVSGQSDESAFKQALQTFREAAPALDFLSTPGVLIFLAKRGCKVVGWCWGQLMVRPDGKIMVYLHELEVLESFRRQGLGSSLLGAFMRASREMGAGKMFLVTGEENEGARALYERLGGELPTQGPTVSYWFDLTSVAPTALT